MYRDTIDFVVRAAASWLFRKRTPESWIFRGATIVLVALWAPNMLFEIYSILKGAPSINDSSAATTVLDSARFALSLMCSMLMLGAAAFAYRRYSDHDARKKVIVIEGRGLRDDAGSPLSAVIAKTTSGVQMPYLLDLRQRVDGSIVDPVTLIPRVAAMNTWLNQVKHGHDRQDLTTVYGGLTAVPFTFLTGVLMDDESKVAVLDWDRAQSEWRSLNEDDDTLRFTITNLESAHGATDVLLAVSASYLVKSEDIETTFTYPVVRMTLPNLVSSHWSEHKQAALANQFLGVVKELDALGVRRIHLILAAQNSLVFNLARRYDRRNLPRITVYQFERDQLPRYPWGIDMPVAGSGEATVIHSRV